MDQTRNQTFVVDQDGVRGTVDAQALARQEQKHVMVTYNGDRHVQVPVAMLERQSENTYHLPLRLSTLESNAQRLKEGEATVIPVIQEEAHIDKRPVERNRMRVTKQVHTQDETIDVSLKQERVQVERIPVEQFVDTAAQPHYEGETLVIPVMEEVLVVEKKLRLKEEIRISKYTEEIPHEETVTLRREEVSVERIT
ncbi:MAG: YsnF/AvaK domain-containing protein [Caldilineaceae bacterium]